MKDHSRRDAGSNGKDRAPQLVREDAQGNHREAGQNGDFQEGESHRLNLHLPPGFFQPDRLPKSNLGRGGHWGHWHDIPASIGPQKPHSVTG